MNVKDEYKSRNLQSSSSRKAIWHASKNVYFSIVFQILKMVVETEKIAILQ